MRKLYFWLAGLLLAASPAAVRAQAGPLHPAQTIALGPHATVGGTVVLPNHNTVLLLTDSESLDIVAQCLAPDGHTLWKTTLTRYGRSQFAAGYAIDTRQIAIGHSARADKQLRRERDLAQLYPVSVFTNNNELVLTEVVSSDAAKLAKKQGITLEAGQRHIQRLNEQGQLTKHLFTALPEPASRKTELYYLAGYADADGYTQVMRETNTREEMLAYTLYHYSLKTKDIQRELIDMPATAKPPGSFSGFKHWYLEWAYLGHRPGQTYFCRRSLAENPEGKRGQQPLLYQVYIVDDHGRANSPSGFTTTLGLSKGTRVAYSGSMRNAGELNHIPRYYTVSNGKYSRTYDEWDVSTGGLGSFYLEHATGDVLLFGEYSEGDLPELDHDNLLGFFIRRYTPDGKVLAQSQTAYSDAMRDDKKRASFKSNLLRSSEFHGDPLTGGFQYSFAPTGRSGSLEEFDLFLDHDLRLLRYDYASGKDKDERIYTGLTYVEPFYLATGQDAIDNNRHYEHPHQTDLPLHAALETQRRAAGLDATYYWFYVSPTGPGTGLVVEKPLGIGGALKVYTF